LPSRPTRQCEKDRRAAAFPVQKSDDEQHRRKQQQQLQRQHLVEGDGNRIAQFFASAGGAFRYASIGDKRGGIRSVTSQRN